MNQYTTDTLIERYYKEESYYHPRSISFKSREITKDSIHGKRVHASIPRPITLGYYPPARDDIPICAMASTIMDRVATLLIARTVSTIIGVPWYFMPLNRAQVSLDTRNRIFDIQSPIDDEILRAMVDYMKPESPSDQISLDILDPYNVQVMAETIARYTIIEFNDRPSIYRESLYVNANCAADGEVSLTYDKDGSEKIPVVFVHPIRTYIPDCPRVFDIREKQQLIIIGDVAFCIIDSAEDNYDYCNAILCILYSAQLFDVLNLRVIIMLDKATGEIHEQVIYDIDAYNAFD